MKSDQIEKVKERLNSKGKIEKDLTDDEDEGVSEEEKVPEKKINFLKKLEEPFEDLDTN